jgi:hypothetical protein
MTIADPGLDYVVRPACGVTCGGSTVSPMLSRVHNRPDCAAPTRTSTPLRVSSRSLAARLDRNPIGAKPAKVHAGIWRVRRPQRGRRPFGAPEGLPGRKTHRRGP